MTDSILTRVQLLAETISAETHNNHAVLASVLRMLCSKKPSHYKWAAVINLLKKLDSEMVELVLLTAEKIPDCPVKKQLDLFSGKQPE